MARPVLLVFIALALLCACADSDAAREVPDSRAVPELPYPTNLTEPDDRSGLSGPTGDVRSRTVRLSGILESARFTRVVAPQLIGPNTQMTLVRIVDNGSRVEAGGIVAEFSTVEQLGLAREAAARYEDLSFQVRQKVADNAVSSESRRSDVEQAEADLEKALLEVSMAEILSEIEAGQNEIRAAKARAEVENIRLVQPDRARAEAAALRIQELQRDRALAEFERAEENLEKLQVRATISGMVVLSTRSSGGTPVRPQQGDQMYRNNHLLDIFDPSEMLVSVNVAEPDGALLEPGLEVTVLVDAYPDLLLPATFVSASPVAARSLNSPLKTFTAVFRLEELDPRLMPDLSAAVVFETGGLRAGESAQAGPVSLP
jgi:hypothetical protein